jgi:antitoxin ParD1/3/4
MRFRNVHNLDSCTDAGCCKDNTLGLELVMAARHSRHIAMTTPLAEFVDGQVEQGQYASASELVRAALRLLMQHHGQTSPDAKRSLPPASDLSIRTILETSHQNQGFSHPRAK